MNQHQKAMNVLGPNEKYLWVQLHDYAILEGGVGAPVHLQCQSPPSVVCNGMRRCAGDTKRSMVMQDQSRSVLALN